MPLTKGDIVVTNISPSVEADAHGEILRMTNVEFTVRGKGPFSVNLPTSAYTAQAANAAVQARARELIETLEFDGE